MPESLVPDLAGAGADVRACARGQAVFRIGDPARHVYLLRRGRVKLQRFGPHGEEVVIHVAVAGELFAEASLHGERYHCTAVALDEVQLLALPTAALRERIASDPAFALSWIATLSRQLHRVRARVERLSLKAAAQRVRHLLLTEGEGEPPTWRPRGTLRDLAGELGLSHEALYRTLAAMERDGQLAREAGALRLLR